MERSLARVAEILACIADPPNVRYKRGPGDLEGLFDFWFDGGASDCTTGGLRSFRFVDGAGALEWRLGRTTVFLADGRTFEVAEFPAPLPYFQLRDLFDREQLDAVVAHPRWVEKYPYLAVAPWSDAVAREGATLPGEIVLAAARECECVGDLYADPDGQTLHMAGRGRTPSRVRERDGQTVVEEITDAVKMSAELAIREFGSDAVWLAQEYGKCRRGERDDRYRRSPGPVEPPEPPAPREADIESQIQRAQEALKIFLRPGHTRGDVFAAIRIWKGLARLRPEWLEPHGALGDLYCELELLPEAKASFQKLAEACLERHDAAAAEAPLRRIIGFDPADLRSRGKLADVCEQIGKREDAIEQHAAVADRLWERGHRPEAIQVVERGLRKLGETAALRSRLEAFCRGD